MRAAQVTRLDGPDAIEVSDVEEPTGDGVVVEVHAAEGGRELPERIDPVDLALITVAVPGADLEEVIAAQRHHLFHRVCLDAIYIDLPLDTPATALVADHLERLGLSYSGIFPNPRADGDVLRMQSLHRVRVKADDIAVASDHGRELLDYVLADLPA